MITPDEVVKKAERKYREVLRDWLSSEDSFPMVFPVGRLSNQLSERRQQITLLRDNAKETIGYGYALQWKTVNKRDLGKQTVPSHVLINDLEDYLALIRKRTEFSHFIADVSKIRSRFSQLEEWIHANPHKVIEYHGAWDDMLTVCDYFIESPRPNLYIRELPIPVHTKFIEYHTGVLTELLNILLPSESIDKTSAVFHSRFGLKSSPVLVRLRLLEEQLDWKFGLRVDDLSLPVEQAAHFLRKHIKPKHVIIVENLINFLTLPHMPNAVGLFGKGFAVHVLREIDWLQQCNLIYWGDIDTQGFEILSDLRGLFPNAVSVMMDAETINDHKQYIGQGKPSHAERFDHLTEAEMLVARQVTQNNLRLEQEQIPQVYSTACLRQVMSGKFKNTR